MKPALTVGQLKEYPTLPVPKTIFSYFEPINLLLTEREGRTGKYWPEVVSVWTGHSEIRTKTTQGQYFAVWLELARSVSSLLHIMCGYRCDKAVTKNMIPVK